MYRTWLSKLYRAAAFQAGCRPHSWGYLSRVNQITIDLSSNRNILKLVRKSFRKNSMPRFRIFAPMGIPFLLALTSGPVRAAEASVGAALSLPALTPPVACAARARRFFTARPTAQAQLLLR